MCNYSPISIPLFSLVNFLGASLWQSNKKNLPFKFIELYINSACMSILPIDNAILSDFVNLKKIRNLYNKMLTVLNLPIGQLSKVEFYYNLKKTLSRNDKRLLTEKLLPYQPKRIMVFGNLEFLDDELLNLRNVEINRILHPSDLSKDDMVNKNIAYRDLLQCKKQLIINAI